MIGKPVLNTLATTHPSFMILRNITFILRQVIFRGVLSCNTTDKYYENWKLNILNHTKIQSDPPGIFIGIHSDNSTRCFLSESSDGSDEWLFIEPPKKLNTKFVIENRKTGKVLEEVQASLQVKSWKNIDSQLWTLRPQNKYQYSIANVASGWAIFYPSISILPLRELQRNAINLNFFIIKMFFLSTFNIICHSLFATVINWNVEQKYLLDF